MQIVRLPPGQRELNRTAHEYTWIIQIINSSALSYLDHEPGIWSIWSIWSVWSIWFLWFLNLSLLLLALETHSRGLFGNRVTYDNPWAPGATDKSIGDLFKVMTSQEGFGVSPTEEQAKEALPKAEVGWDGMVWYGMVWYVMVWCGMVWYGMAWFAMVWFSMVWYGMVWFVMMWFCMVY